MLFKTIIAILCCYISLVSHASDLEKLSRGVNDFIEKYDISNEKKLFDLYPFALGIIAEKGQEYKTEIIFTAEDIQKSDKYIQSLIKNEADLKQYRPELDKIDSDYELLLSLMRLVADRLVTFAHNISTMSISVLKTCEEGDDLLNQYKSVKSKYDTWQSFVEAKSRILDQLISIQDWDSYLIQRKETNEYFPSCETIISYSASNIISIENSFKTNLTRP